MTRYIYILLMLGFISLLGTANAATHYQEPQYAVLMALDTKSKTVIIRNELYKLKQAVKIHDIAKKFPGLSSLTVGNEIKFMTRKNPSTGNIEISEIWVLHQ